MLFSQYILQLHTGDICLLKIFVLTGKFAPSVCHKMIKFCWSNPKLSNSHKFDNRNNRNETKGNWWKEKHQKNFTSYFLLNSHHFLYHCHCLSLKLCLLPLSASYGPFLWKIKYNWDNLIISNSYSLLNSHDYCWTQLVAIYSVPQIYVIQYVIKSDNWRTYSTRQNQAFWASFMW